MEVTVLGTSGAYPAPGHPASGYLVQAEGFTVCLDLGTGTLAALQEHVSITDLGGVVVSHRHFDHFLDLYPLFVARFFAPESLPALPVVAPTGFREFLARLQDSDGGVENLAQVFDIREVGFGEEFELGPFRFETREMRHLVPTIGVRVHNDGRVLAYTGDTGPSGEVVELARDADLLIAEASWQDREDPPPFHLTARQAAEHASGAGARRLMLSHFWPTHDRSVSEAQAREAFGGELLLAHEGQRMEVGG